MPLANYFSSSSIYYLGICRRKSQTFPSELVDFLTRNRQISNKRNIKLRVCGNFRELTHVSRSSRESENIDYPDNYGITGRIINRSLQVYSLHTDIVIKRRFCIIKQSRVGRVEGRGLRRAKCNRDIRRSSMASSTRRSGSYYVDWKRVIIQKNTTAAQQERFRSRETRIGSRRRLLTALSLSLPRSPGVFSASIHFRLIETARVLLRPDAGIELPVMELSSKRARDATPRKARHIRGKWQRPEMLARQYRRARARARQFPFDRRNVNEIGTMFSSRRTTIARERARAILSVGF